MKKNLSIAAFVNEYPLALECRVVEVGETSLGETRVVGEKVGDAWQSGKAILERQVWSPHLH